MLSPLTISLHAPAISTCIYNKLFYLYVKSALLCIPFAVKGHNYAVLRGSSVRINCIPQNTQVEGESDVGSSYSWTDQDDKEIIAARFTKLASGELEITNAHIADSGIYTCKFRPATTWESKNNGMERTFQHKLIGKCVFAVLIFFSQL